MKKIKDLSFFQKQLEERDAHLLGHPQYSANAVLVPLVSKKGEWHVLFEVRSQFLRRQPGEICFPGGRIDRIDRSAQHAAVRETCEELGLLEEDIEVWGALDYLATPFNLIIYPFVGKLTVDTDEIQPNEAEVGEVFYVPLNYLLETTPQYHELNLFARPKEDFPFHLIPQQENYRWRTGKVPEYFYFYEDYVIWGMTARILHHFLELIKVETEIVKIR